MAKIENGKVRIGGHDIVVAKVLAWMKKQGHAVTAVQMRDQFGWKLRQTARVLMRLLAKENKVIIHDHPTRKRSYCYTLPGQPKPTKETFAKPEEQAQEEAKAAYEKLEKNKTPKETAKTKESKKVAKGKDKSKGKKAEKEKSKPAKEIDTLTRAKMSLPEKTHPNCPKCGVEAVVDEIDGVLPDGSPSVVYKCPACKHIWKPKRMLEWKEGEATAVEEPVEDVELPPPGNVVNQATKPPNPWM